MSWTLDELLPHRAPMMLIDGIESFDPERRALTATVLIGPNQLLFSPSIGGVPNWVAIEYMAQTCAALAGCFDKTVAPDQPARPGLLLGTRKLELNLERFEAGRTYRITSVNAFQDSDAAAFECSIADETGNVVATATLNAYRPPNLENFLREQAAT